MKEEEDWVYASTFSWPQHYLEQEGYLQAPATLPPREKPPCANWIEGWVGP
jgi:hypothetical protein